MEHENSSRAFDRALGIQNTDISPLMNNNNSSEQMDKDEKNILSGNQLFSSTVNPDANAPTAPATPTGIDNSDSNALDDQFLTSNEEQHEIQNNASTIVIEKKSPIGTPQKDFISNVEKKKDPDITDKKQDSPKTAT